MSVRNRGVVMRWCVPGGYLRWCVGGGGGGGGGWATSDKCYGGMFVTI